MNIKERLLQFIDYKGLTKRKFCENISVSHTYINDLKTMQSDKLENISVIFPDLNITWLVTGRGEMIVKIDESEEKIRNKKKFIVKDSNEMISHELVENKAMLRMLLKITGELLASNRKEANSKTITEISKGVNDELLATLDEIKHRYG